MACKCKEAKKLHRKLGIEEDALSFGRKIKLFFERVLVFIALVVLVPIIIVVATANRIIFGEAKVVVPTEWLKIGIQLNGENLQNTN